MDIDPESCYRAVAEPGPALRRCLLHRRAHHRHLLPPVVSGRTPLRRTSPSTAPPPPRRRRATGPAGGVSPTRRPARRPGTSRGDGAGRAMRLIADGVVERRGSQGWLDGGLHPAPSHPAAGRELGAGPLALARAQPCADARDAHRDDVEWRSPTSPSPPASPASGSSTTPCVRSTRTHPDAAAAARKAGPRSHGTARGPGGAAARGAAAVRGTGTASFLAARAVPGVEEARAAVVLPRRCGCRTVRRRRGSRLGDAGRAAGAPGACSLRLERPARPRTRPSSAAAACSTPTATRWPSTRPGRGPRLLAPLVRRPPGLCGPRPRRRRRARDAGGARAAGRGGRRDGAGCPPRGALRGRGARRPGGGVTRLFPCAQALALSLRPRVAGPAVAGPRAASSGDGADGAGEVALDRSAAASRSASRLLAVPGVGPVDRRLHRDAGPG